MAESGIPRARPGSWERRDVRIDDEFRTTDRRLEILGVAHEMGYYERPRSATHGEIAERLEIRRNNLSRCLSQAENDALSFLAERINLDPLEESREKRDRRENPLPARLEVGVMPTGTKFHLADGDGLVCQRWRGTRSEVETVALEDAREQRNRTACEACFKLSWSDRVPRRVEVLLGREAATFHENEECAYIDDNVTVTVNKSTARDVELEPCRACFGADPGRLRDSCPLCGMNVGFLKRHLPDCPERQEIAQ